MSGAGEGAGGRDAAMSASLVGGLALHPNSSGFDPRPRILRAQSSSSGGCNGTGGIVVQQDYSDRHDARWLLSLHGRGRRPSHAPGHQLWASHKTYVVWAATSTLDRIERLGPLVPG